MLIMTTYGTWLRGEKCGFVEDGKICRADRQITYRLLFWLVGVALALGAITITLRALTFEWE
jgi:hypothetical protein